MRIVVIDGQGGGFGRALIEKLRAAGCRQEIIAVGTNAMATSAMLKAGATAGATGENAVIVNAGRADVLAGPWALSWQTACWASAAPPWPWPWQTAPRKRSSSPPASAAPQSRGCRSCPWPTTLPTPPKKSWRCCDPQTRSQKPGPLRLQPAGLFLCSSNKKQLQTHLHPPRGAGGPKRSSPISRASVQGLGPPARGIVLPFCAAAPAGAHPPPAQPPECPAQSL